MTTHLSARLSWHDGAWNGCVCRTPHLNTSCIVHEHIRDTRDDEREQSFAGTVFDDLDGWLPPCSRDAGAYAARGYWITHHDPLEFRDLPPVGEEIPSFSCCPSPYRWMREEQVQEICNAENLTIRGPDYPKEVGWVSEPDRQLILLNRFWEKIEPGRSLIFYYCNHGNPLDENAARVVLGVGRISEIGPQLYFGTTSQYPDPHPVWSRRITQEFPAQGVRIPYQEYLQKGRSAGDIMCLVPRGAMLAFSYVAEHVSDDVAVSILERVIQSVERVEDRVVTGDWDQRLAWLNDALAEVWTGRGPFPGLGSVLQYLGFSKGTAYHRLVLAPMAKKGTNPCEHVTAVLEGRRKPEPGPYQQGLLKAREQWAVRRSRQALLAKLARFELTPDQVKRIANPDLRCESGIHATDEEIVANPYILSERDLGTEDSQPVSLETIDHGMRPEGDAALFPDEDEVSHDDRRRVRAVAHAVLREAADAGDTVLPFPELVDRIAQRFPKRRVCQPDREVMVAEGEFYRDLLWTAFDSDPQRVALKQIEFLEQHVASVVKRRIKRKNQVPDPPIDWRAALEQHFGKPSTVRARAAIQEKTAALKRLFRHRLSVLTGGAGTGKTSVLRVFLDDLERREGRHPVLLLAPTGKARVRLSTRTGRNAMTIHQFLLRQGWFASSTFALRDRSDQDTYKATTVVIDECSMIPVDLFGTLLRALDMGPLTRLVLVGDPNQLPPIGPGRPFIDVIEWLKAEQPDCIAPLNVCMRVDEEGEGPAEEGSVALELAGGYRADAVNPGDDEVLAAVARGESRGDLEVVFWQNHDDLREKLKDRMAAHLGFGDGDYRGFNRSLGIEDKDWERSEAWQILSPTRTQHFGTDDLNRLIQMEYRKGLIRKAQNRWSRSPRPFGDLEIVWTDKVIQVCNQSRNAWPRNAGLDYVANGEIGIVTETQKRREGSDCLDVVFSTQADVSYRYYRGQVNDCLELAYALTVHKAQGSDFDVVFLIIPQSASTLSRELIYTGLTRFRKKLVLLIEKDVQPLLQLRSSNVSDTRLRNTQMFKLALRSMDAVRPHQEALIHRTRKGVAVRSKSEVIVADILDSLGISYEYERPLYSPTNPRDFRLPDFTVSFEGDIYYWEHLGMLHVPEYREAWERKQAWYAENGFAEALITSEDGPDGSIDAAAIEHLARQRILCEEE